ncbi:hypothetical protein AOP6_2786 [Desulfuromonas sp. AOP6]|nr:hypothetical protein AOP6_2786 [Desulfuromonas sp. AOP6]
MGGIHLRRRLCSLEIALPVLEDKLFQRIKKLAGKAIGEFNLIEEGDRILVGVSGGKLCLVAYL